MAQAITPDAIMQLGFGYWGSKTLLSAVELEPVHRTSQRAAGAGFRALAALLDTWLDEAG